MGALQQNLEHEIMKRQMAELYERFGLDPEDKLGKRVVELERRVAQLEEHVAALVDPDRIVTEVRDGAEVRRRGRPPMSRQAVA